jgi:hypothetical protein
MDIENIEAVRDLHAELAKTAVLSDAFKDFLIRSVFLAIEEAAKLAVPREDEREAFRNEFRNRLFTDKTSVKLGSRTFSDLLESLQGKGYAGAVLGHLLDMNYPEPRDGISKLLTGTYDEVLAVREWLWRSLNEDPMDICDAERREENVRKNP